MEYIPPPSKNEGGAPSTQEVMTAYSLRTWGAACCAPTQNRHSRRLGAGALDFDEEFGEFLFAFGLVVAAFSVGELGDVHGAELGAAHGAELCFLVEVVGQVLVVHGLCGRRVE